MFLILKKSRRGTCISAKKNMPPSLERRFYIPRGKRFIDVAISGIAILVLSPLLLLLALMVRLKLGSPVLFRDTRPGFRGEPFTMLKFRTMTNARDKEGRFLPDTMRMTRFGRLLRSSSLDELPELFNVLRGDMSLVGPRPLLMEYLGHYSPIQMRRHDAVPGITGWAQVNGRTSVSWEKRFEMDVWYVDYQSIWLDLKILLMTFSKILMREGIGEPGKCVPFVPLNDWPQTDNTNENSCTENHVENARS
jgi:sugar transferase EpsL